MCDKCIPYGSKGWWTVYKANHGTPRQLTAEEKDLLKMLAEQNEPVEVGDKRPIADRLQADGLVFCSMGLWPAIEYSITFEGRKVLARS